MQKSGWNLRLSGVQCATWSQLTRTNSSFLPSVVGGGEEDDDGVAPASSGQIPRVHARCCLVCLSMAKWIDSAEDARCPKVRLFRENPSCPWYKSLMLRLTASNLYRLSGAPNCPKMEEFKLLSQNLAGHVHNRGNAGAQLDTASLHLNVQCLVQNLALSIVYF